MRARLTDVRMTQVFSSEKLFIVGLSKITYAGVELRIYNKEHMLIELFRNKSKFPYDYYGG